MRGVMIGVGAVLIQRFDWILYLFVRFLLYAGFKLFGATTWCTRRKIWCFTGCRSFCPCHRRLRGAIVRAEAGRWLATPLLLVVIVLETTDLFSPWTRFPQCLASREILFWSTAQMSARFLGLRALYFYCRNPSVFSVSRRSLAIVLMFVGAKMLADPWNPHFRREFLSESGSIIRDGDLQFPSLL